MTKPARAPYFFIMATNKHLSKGEREHLKSIASGLIQLTENEEIAAHDTIAILRIFESRINLTIEQHLERIGKNATD